MKPTILYNLTPIQKKYLRDFEHRFYVVPPGRRSRKTLIGEHKVLYVVNSIPEIRSFLAAPTRKQAKEIFWERLVNDTQFIRQAISYSDLKVRLLNGSTIQVEGLDRPERLEGSPWDYGLITETGNTKPGFWENHIRPVFSDTARKVYVDDKKNNIEYIQLGACLLDGVPEGRNHYYDYALRACGGVIPQTEPGKGQFKESGPWAYYHWFSSDVLSMDEIEEARRDLDERTFAQEYEGQFVSYEGQLYYNFSRENVNDKVAYYNSQEPLYLSCDFNKSPLCFGIVQKRGKNIVVVDEITIQYNAKTQQAAEMFCERYKNAENRLVYLTGDASGKVETTRDYTTDYIIIEDILKRNGFQVRLAVPSFNPNVNNRVNLVCSLLKSVTGEIRCFINSKCTFLINDLERNVGDGKGGKDKSDPQQTHASDWFDYVVSYIYDNEFYKKTSGQARIG